MQEPADSLVNPQPNALHRVWVGGEADEALLLVAICGLTPAETCHVVLHELAHVPTARSAVPARLNAAVRFPTRRQTAPLPRSR